MAQVVQWYIYNVHSEFYATSSNGANKIRRQTYHAIFLDIYLLFFKNRVILASVVLSQYIRVINDNR